MRCCTKASYAGSRERSRGSALSMRMANREEKTTHDLYILQKDDVDCPVPRLQVDRAASISDALHVPLFLGTGIQQDKWHSLD